MSVRKTMLGAGSAVLLATVVTFSSHVSAFAQEAAVAAPAVSAACFQAPAKLSDEDVAAFTANPAGMLTEYPTGGLPMSSQVRALAGSSSSTIDAILGLVPAATSDQKSAIGSGLARAARACATVNPEYAALIQEKVASIDSPEVVAAFLSASNEVQTAALGAAGGAAGGGGAGGIGGGGAAGLGSAGFGGDTAVAQSGPAGFSAGGGSFSAGSETISVSPTN